MFKASNHILPAKWTPRPMTRKFIARFIKIKFIKVLFMGCFTFSVIFSSLQLVNYFFSVKSLKPLKRPYETNQMSPLSEMNSKFCFTKIHSKTSRKYSDALQQFYFRGELTPEEDDVTVATFVTQDDYDDLIRLAEAWQGPISAVLHVSTKTLNDTHSSFNELYKRNPFLKRHVDIHLVAGLFSPLDSTIISRPTNFHMNVARLFARTDFVLFLDQDTWPSPMTRSYIRRNKELLLREDVMILPTFAHTENASNHDFPQTSEEIKELVQRKAVGMRDHGWPLNDGPTNYEDWSKMEIYSISEYDLNYQPNFVIKRGSNIPWCTEQFGDFDNNKAACLLQIYLNGADLWVVPDAFLIEYHYNKNDLLKSAESKWEKIIKDRLYTNFYRAACMHYSRTLSSLGKWNTPEANNAKQLCPRIITNWGFGIIG
ncbi:3842_t:CDS:2 [Acaulospora morrowiae]|uniref:3842_t:CDS:1 n=1 Tax=Acaulospora morrowiae TaxID=94023 RepID=A0A9N9B3Q4_9GLOM|nr:3842_t:CDS:2 [Acaulospora morrowiae]